MSYRTVSNDRYIFSMPNGCDLTVTDQATANWLAELINDASESNTILAANIRLFNERDVLREKAEQLRNALHCISLGAQNSMTSKEALGREARAALEHKPVHDPHAEALAPTTEVDGSTDVALDAFYWHEALDRTHTINVMLESLLLEHPVIDQHIELLELAEKASDALHALYQAIGNATPNDPDR